MERVIFAEVLDRHGEVRERARITALPFTIGRDYRCDLILDDPHVDAQHLRVEPDLVEGDCRLRDLGSLNGVMLLDPKRSISSAPLQSGQRVRLGRTVIRFVDEAHPVDTPVPLIDRPAWLAWVTEHWGAAFALGAAVTSAEIARTYRENYAPLDGFELASGQIWLLGLLMLWVGGWALVTRVLTHHARFVAHWAVTCTAALALLASEELLFYARFFFAPIDSLQTAETAFDLTLTGAALYAHLSVVGVLRPLRRLATAGAVAVALVGANTLADYRDGATDWVTVLPYWSRLKPVDTAWLPIESEETFFAGALALRDQVDALAEEADVSGSASDGP